MTRLADRTGRTTRRLTGVLTAVLCLGLDVAALCAVVSAFRVAPSGPWDDAGLIAVELSSFTGGLIATLSGLVRAVPIAMGRMRAGWFVPPAVLLLIAILRFFWVDVSYPL